MGYKALWYIRILCISKTTAVENQFGTKPYELISLFFVTYKVAQILTFNPSDVNHNCCLLCVRPVSLKVIVAISLDPDQNAHLGAV